MFELLNQLLIAQIVMITISTALALAEYQIRSHGARNSVFLRQYLAHLALQARMTGILLTLSTYADRSLDFDLKTSFPYIFAAAGLAGFSVFAMIRIAKTEAAAV